MPQRVPGGPSEGLSESWQRVVSNLDLEESAPNTEAVWRAGSAKPAEKLSHAGRVATLLKVPMLCDSRAHVSVVRCHSGPQQNSSSERTPRTAVRRSALDRLIQDVLGEQASATMAALASGQPRPRRCCEEASDFRVYIQAVWHAKRCGLGDFWPLPGLQA